MKISIRPIEDPDREVDVTNQLVSAIAEELRRLFGGNETLNLIEAEWHLQRIIAQVQTEARETEVVRAASSAPEQAIKRRMQPAPRMREVTRLSKHPRPRNGVRRAKKQRTSARAANSTSDATQMTGAAIANA